MGELDPDRDQFLRDSIREAGLGGILAWYPEDLVMTAGTWPCLGINLCIYPVEGTPRYFAALNEPEDVLPGFAECHRFELGSTWMDDLARLIADELQSLGVRPDELGIAADEGGHAVTAFSGEAPPLTHTTVTQKLLGGPPTVAPDLFTKLTAKKTPTEQAAVSRANDVACIGLEAFYDSCKPGVSEVEIAAAVEKAIHMSSGQGGVRLARGWAHVQGGENIFWGGTYSRSSGNRLTSGDLVIIELATCADGYWSDLTRTTGVGTISQDLKDLLSAVQSAQRAATRTIGPGVSHAAVYAAAWKVFDEKGLAGGFPHNAGHHVGFRYHDRGPMLLPGNDQLLQPGMVLTVEPGTYGREFGGGARFEDNVLVTDDGCDVLSCNSLQPF